MTLARGNHRLPSTDESWPYADVEDEQPADDEVDLDVLELRVDPRAYLGLEAQGESVTRLVGLLARRVRDVLAIATRLEAGESPPQIKQSLKMSPWAADRRIAEARRSDVDRLSLTLETLADLELAAHGGSELSDRTEAIRAIARIAT